MDGQVKINLDVNPFRLNCNGDIEYISKTILNNICQIYIICVDI